MKFESWERLGADPRRALAVVTALSTGLFAVTVAVGLELGTGSFAVVLGGVAGAVASYLLATSPRRVFQMAAFRQTLEAPSLAAASNIYLRSTGSRSKTLLLIRAEETNTRSFLAVVRRRLLLGYDPGAATGGASPQERLFSESTKSVVESVVGIGRSRVDQGGEELDGMLASGELEEETRTPLFFAVAFFLPIMLMMFAAMAKQTGTWAIAGLLFLEVVILDLAMAVSATTVSWKKEAGP